MKISLKNLIEGAEKATPGDLCYWTDNDREIIIALCRIAEAALELNRDLNIRFEGLKHNSAKLNRRLGEALAAMREG